MKDIDHIHMAIVSCTSIYCPVLSLLICGFILNQQVTCKYVVCWPLVIILYWTGLDWIGFASMMDIGCLEKQCAFVADL